jgi:hypothetical protein
MNQGISESAAGGLPGVITPARRVRHEMRDTLTVMAFSAAASSGVAVLLAFVVRLGN